MPKIKWIEINGFRSFGDGPQRLEFGSPIAVAWGPNSQGKTSIAEAFEFLLTGIICRCELTASVQDEFADSLRNAHMPVTAKVFVAACFEAADGTLHTVRRVLVEDYGKRNKCSSALTVDGKSASQDDLKHLGLHLSAPPLSAPILFQHTLGYLFSVSPKERSMYFKTLLEVADLEELREAIAEAGKLIVGDPPALLSKLQTCAATLKNSTRLQSLLTLIPSAKDIGSAFSETASDLLKAAGVQVPPDENERYAQVRDLLTQLRSKTFPVAGLTVAVAATWSAPADATWQDIEAFLKKAKEVDEETKRLSRLLSEVLAVPDVAAITSPIDCPVCATPKALTPDRVQTIRNRLTANRDYDSLRQKAESAMRDLEGMANGLAQIAKQLEPQPIALKREWRRKNGFAVRKVRELLGTSADGLVRDWLRATAQLLRAIRAVKLATTDAGNASKTFTANLANQTSTSLLRELFEKCATACQKMRDAQDRYADSTTRLKSELQAVIDKQSAVEGWENFLELAASQAELFDALAERRAATMVADQHTHALKEIDRAIECVLEAKFSSLSSEVGVWWDRLRPDEETFFYSVKQRPKARRTVDFKVGVSLGPDRTKAPLRDAVAVFSQSQLHCLGLASFLARSIRERNGFMVFDDPVVSSDEDYRAHFVCTVLEELINQGQQVILLTQDQRTWKDVSERYASKDVDVFQITRDTGVTTVTKTSDGLTAMLTKAEPYVRSEHPEMRKRAAEILRDALERFCKELLVKNRREQGEAAAKITDYDGKTLGDLFPKVNPLLKDISHPGKLKFMEGALNPGKHDDTIPSKGNLSCALGDLKKFRADYLK